MMLEAAFMGLNMPEVALTINRVCLGTAFMLSGLHKTFVPRRHEALVSTLEYARIPAPRLMCWPVCLTELFGGLGLMVGFLSGLSALGIIVLSIVATLTVEIWTIRDMKPDDVLDAVDDVFWLPAVLFTIMGLVVLLVGPGYGFDEIALSLFT